MAISDPNNKSKKKLSNLSSDCLMLILQLRATNEYGDAENLRKKVIELLDDFERKALTSGIEQSKIQASKFALVAFIDETIIGSEWTNKVNWLAEPLQLKLFNCFNAGQEYFTRLEQLRQRQRENTDVLELYFLCMSLGFRGKYQLEAPEKVRLIIDELHQDLNQYLGRPPELISPNGMPNDEIVNVVKERIPVWVVVVTSFSIGFFFYVIMSYLISNDADELIASITKMIS
jgi:type VI secretion system protein ImpK